MNYLISLFIFIFPLLQSSHAFDVAVPFSYHQGKFQLLVKKPEGGIIIEKPTEPFNKIEKIYRIWDITPPSQAISMTTPHENEQEGGVTLFPIENVNTLYNNIVQNKVGIDNDNPYIILEKKEQINTLGLEGSARDTLTFVFDYVEKEKKLQTNWNDCYGKTPPRACKPAPPLSINESRAKPEKKAKEIKTIESSSSTEDPLSFPLLTWEKSRKILIGGGIIITLFGVVRYIIYPLSKDKNPFTTFTKNIFFYNKKT
jgi:hypothetical protein